MISTIMLNPSPNDNRKQTLIIAPLALLEQWREEIETKSNGRLKAWVYHGKDKISVRKMKAFDVILTTLG